MAPDQREFVQDLKTTLVAVVSAAVTATLVIGAGEALLREPPPATIDAQAGMTLVRTAG